MTMQLLMWHLLVPFGLFIALFAIFAAIDIMHMVKFGTYTFANYLALVAFLAGSAVIFWAMAQLLGSVEWSQPIGDAFTPDFFTSSNVDL